MELNAKCNIAPSLPPEDRSFVTVRSLPRVTPRTVFAVSSGAEVQRRPSSFCLKYLADTG
ncbi:unnamed protein product [Penicillium camemberti]|uniref:Str. FM013 n=1 Tax=Penicillium camemberti (strain FM 013) TaxID=1429867 RepID=A0A0G4PDK7_PENC3|nr:unnamed protein product [Penicillium camemberti]